MSQNSLTNRIAHFLDAHFGWLRSVTSLVEGGGQLGSDSGATTKNGLAHINGRKAFDCSFVSGLPRSNVLQLTLPGRLISTHYNQYYYFFFLLVNVERFVSCQSGNVTKLRKTPLWHASVRHRNCGSIHKHFVLNATVALNQQARGPLLVAI